jgi:hypothetical protein
MAFGRGAAAARAYPFIGQDTCAPWSQPSWGRGVQGPPQWPTWVVSRDSESPIYIGIDHSAFPQHTSSKTSLSLY